MASLNWSNFIAGSSLGKSGVYRIGELSRNRMRRYEFSATLIYLLNLPEL
jgi:hypothetical protein